MSWPITWEDVLEAKRRISSHLAPTPLRHYAALDREVGADVRVLVKHENHLPTNAFKARNALSFMTALEPAQRTRGVVLWGTLSGSMLPFLLRRVGADPATSSAPFVATLVDVTGLIIYFSIALLIMRGSML